MKTLDDDVDRLFRAANPAPKPIVPEPLPAAARALRESIIRGTVPRARRVRSRITWAAFATASAAVVVGVIVTANILMPSQQAAALTPPPLTYASAPPLSDVLADATGALRAPGGPRQESRVDSVGWGWSVDMGSKQVEIVPQEISFRWGATEPGIATITAGESYWSDNERPDGVDASPYEPGELIDTVITAPDELGLPPAARDLSGSSPADLESALAVFGATADSSSGELAAAITGLFGFWTLDDDQHATLLTLLDETGDLAVRGTTVDRLGRDVIGLAVSPTIPERQETLFVSVDTGRIVGVESELTAPLDGLPTGVISYTMWDAASGSAE
ncbi:hypothetical protein [Microbacterium sp. 3J1]|uniref:hypothetical protein n=1 Tax=Microbacterium sp. 3J1 TaxID=861269 RepID=UPI000A803E87|nr:hypothetical protein [Microbacterium sp. 3J1]